MSNLVITIETLLTHLFGNTVRSFAGVYEIDSNELKEMREEVCNHAIPSIRDDRKNLKSDSKNVVSDYRKAFESKKASY